ncbi:C-type lectin protein [Schizophyllum commune]
MSATLSSLPAVMANFLPSHSVEEVSPAASSDASDSRSSVGDSRSVSPVASDSSSTSARSDALSVWPRSWSTITVEALTPSCLSALFDAEAVDGKLGVVRCGADEVAEVLPEDFASEGLPPYISTTPTEAAIQSIISAAGLRAIISFPSPSGKQSFHVLERPRVAFAPVAHTPGFPAEGGVLEVPKGGSSSATFTATTTTSCSLTRDAGTTTIPIAPTSPTPSPLGNIPTEAEWESLWRAWDIVTLSMIPPAMLHQKPIDLRHKCLFYIGHIPTFLDMLLDKAERLAGVDEAGGGGPSEPAYFWNVFERGIDPHVDDPEHCHNHSEVPTRDEDWPTLEQILAFRDRVRARLMRLYADLRAGRVKLSRNIARTLSYTLEHEGFHVETLLYMLIQRAGTGTLPPPGFTPPPWDFLKAQWDAMPAPATPTAKLGPATITLGHDDSEGEDFLRQYAEKDGQNAEDKSAQEKGLYTEDEIVNHEFGWDNESPARATHVGAFRAEWRPVTNGEFEAYWRKSDGKVPMPKSWVEEEGEVKVRTMYGPVAFDIARHWPVLTAYDDLAAYAASKGGRLPTEPELRLFLDMYDFGHAGGANVGFRNWHPVPATAGLDLATNTTTSALADSTPSATNTNTTASPSTTPPPGAGSNGGVWEWTSTLFDTHPGLTPTQLFPGYSTDFFDTKHQVVLGASYATIPRLGRRTVRNFYQHNYPYPWVAGRVVYDV